MAWVAVAVAAVSVVSSVQAGRAQEAAYESEAKQAELESKASSIERMRELNRALAMQEVMMGASGRTFEGSPQLIQKEDIKKGKQDIELIKAGGASKASSLMTAGSQAKRASLYSAASSAGKTYMQTSQIK